MGAAVAVWVGVAVGEGVGLGGRVGAGVGEDDGDGVKVGLGLGGGSKVAVEGGDEEVIRVGARVVVATTSGVGEGVEAQAVSKIAKLQANQAAPNVLHRPAFTGDLLPAA